jgi:hypothetical protein
VIPIAVDRDITVVQKSRKRIVVIENGNWIYILRGGKVPSSLNELTTELP